MKKNEFTSFIDLDGTVYDKHNGMWEELSARIDFYMDDTLKKLAAPHQMGWTSVWIDGYEAHPSASYSVPNIEKLPNLINDIKIMSRPQPFILPKPRFADKEA
jgi:FMN phosphatase YigB (HAD superfamily)